MDDTGKLFMRSEDGSMVELGPVTGVHIEPLPIAHAPIKMSAPESFGFGFSIDIPRRQVLKLFAYVQQRKLDGRKRYYA